jgi:ATP-binding cassette, subfamily B, multidrug efflux pump
MLKLLKYLKPYRIQIVLIFVLLFARAMSELFLPTLMARIVDIGILTGDIAFIWRVGLQMLIVTAAGTATATASSFFSARTASAFGRDVRRDLFSRVQSFSLNEFDEIGTSAIITRTTNDIQQVQQTVIMMLRMMLFAPMMAVGGIIMAVSKDPPLSVVLLAVIPAITLTIAAAAAKGVPLFTKIQQNIDRLTLVMRESLVGVRVIRAFNKHEQDTKRFDEASRSLTDISISVNKLMAVIMPVIMLLFNLTTVAVIWIGGKRIAAGGMMIGDLMAFIQYIMRIMTSLVMLSMMFIMIPRAAVSAARIQEVLGKNPEITDPPDPQEFEPLNAGRVEFRDVTFRYHGAEEPAVCGVSFTAEPGRVTAVIGGTGSGKSTIINLIPRFYDVESGAVLVGGKDVRRVSQRALRSRIGLSPQRSLLFSGTVADTIRFGSPDISDAQTAEAAETAQADGFISGMEDGYKSLISQGGVNVSGGQRQRLAIARAIAQPREVYLFDDSFSALDYKTDAALRKALLKKTAEAAVIIVSQRISTVMQADHIIVLDEGRVESQGTHDELMNRSALYREIASSQLEGGEAV